MARDAYTELHQDDSCKSGARNEIFNIPPKKTNLSFVTYFQRIDTTNVQVYSTTKNINIYRYLFDVHE